MRRGNAEGAPRMERAMEQLNRLTRSLRRARTVELPEGERGRGAGLSAGRGRPGGGRTSGRVKVGWKN